MVLASSILDWSVHSPTIPVRSSRDMRYAVRQVHLVKKEAVGSESGLEVITNTHISNIYYVVRTN